MKYNIYDDLYRYSGKRNLSVLLRYVFFTPGFRYIYFFRQVQNSKYFVFHFLWKVLLRQTMLRTVIQIPPETKIGPGMRIVHFGHIVINPKTVIGKNFNIARGVTLGFAAGRKSGFPIIGDNVSIQPNAVVVGGVKIGDNVLIAPNSFVNIDVPDGCIAIGNPAKIIQTKYASSKYIVYKI